MAVANAIEHGSPADAAVEVALTVTPRRARIQVVDEGHLGASMPLTAPVPPPADQPRGRGRLVMRELADHVEVHANGHGTSVLLQFDRPAVGLFL